MCSPVVREGVGPSFMVFFKAEGCGVKGEREG